MNERMQRRVPNRVVLCVDEIQNDDIVGRIFTSYDSESKKVLNSMQAFKIMDDMYDRIKYPQSAVKIRGFGKNKAVSPSKEKPVQVRDSVEIMENRGKIATFAIDVTARQNATWQGIIYWIENDVINEFASLMDMMVLIDTVVM